MDRDARVVEATATVRQWALGCGNWSVWLRKAELRATWQLWRGPPNIRVPALIDFRSVVAGDGCGQPLE